ncbi:hypothetical protein B9Z33_13985 [Limnohabitans sp. T6-20]|nr:hypothetical protein B9Z33_13985 [Limnohabitans sp. T6-20]
MLKGVIVMVVIVLDNVNNRQAERCNKMKHKELFSQFKALYELASDAEAAYVLGVQKTALSAYINEKKPIPVPLKFRLLEHVHFSPEIRKVAAAFLNEDEHVVQLTQDLDRLEELRRRQAGMAVNFADQKWIERVSSLQAKHGLTDSQTAQYLEMKESDLAGIKAGKRELGLDQKALLLGLLAVKDIVHKETLKRKLNKRIEKS